MNLHRARRALLVSIDDARRQGRSTVKLEEDLATKQRETRLFRAYLLAHL